jgi:HAD superfamily hydrolase (TIGR01509 family)
MVGILKCRRRRKEVRVTADAIRAVLFDLGGTLWELRPGVTIEQILTTAASKAIALLPPLSTLPPSPAEIAVAVRRAYVALEEAAACGDTTPVPAEAPVLRGLASLGLEVDSATARSILQVLHVPERQTTRLLEGAEGLLQSLALRGVRLGIISNRLHGGTLLLDDLDYFGISHLFLTMVASCDAGQMKPHPLLFEQALEALGVWPEEAVMVGDDLRADVGAALALGMRAIWIRRPPERPDMPPPGVPAVTHLTQVLPALEQLGTLPA